MNFKCTFRPSERIGRGAALWIQWLGFPCEFTGDAESIDTNSVYNPRPPFDRGLSDR